MENHFQYLDPHTEPENVYGLKIFQNPEYEYTYYPHYHNFCEFTLITEGTVLHIVNSQAQILHSHTLNFVRANDVHYYKRYDNNSVCKYNVGIPNDILFQALNYYGIAPEMIYEPEMPFAVLLNQQEYYNLFNKLEKFQNLDFGTEHGIIFLNIVSDVLYLLLRAEKQTVNFTKMPDWFNKLIIALESPENFTIGIDKLKTISNYSTEYINRCFKKYLSITPSEYINRLRIEHAAKLLIDGKDNILNICYLVGFKNEGYFYKRFKEYYNMTPNEFARAYRK